MEIFSLHADPAVAFLLSLLQFEQQGSEAVKAHEWRNIYTCNTWSYEMNGDPNDTNPEVLVKPAHMFCEKDS